VADAPAAGAAQPSSASLFMLDPGGEAHKYFGTAVGKGRQQAKTEIERLALGSLTCRQALVEVAKIIHKGHDEKVSSLSSDPLARC
jgi:20S proteasome subunit alpha 7